VPVCVFVVAMDDPLKSLVKTLLQQEGFWVRRAGNQNSNCYTESQPLPFDGATINLVGVTLRLRVRVPKSETA
jgi:hypothetical protein